MNTITKRAAALLLLIIAVNGCTLSTVPATASLDNIAEEIVTATEQPTYPPTITPRPTVVTTHTPHPTNTLRPAPTPTFDPPVNFDPQPTEAEIDEPSSALSVAGDDEELPAGEPQATIVNPTQAPAAAANPTQVPVSSGQSYSGHISNVGSHLDAIYTLGQQLGNNPRAFSKIGDCEAAFSVFLQDFDRGSYDLADYQYLDVVLNHFAGSFKHIGQAADGGMSSTALLNSFWSDPDVCEPGETPLDCEYRTHKPSIALIMVRTIDADAVANGQFRSELLQIVQHSLDRGIIPVLSTIPYWGPWNPDTALINATIRQVASEKKVPLWDFWATSEQLPNRGVTQDYHIADPAYQRSAFFDADSLQMAVTRRNLEALEVLHAILAQVS